MSNRTTKAEVKGMFNRFLKVIGGREATSYYDVGAYVLDYNSYYGGYKIELIDELGGVSSAFTERRLTPREMYRALYFACNVAQHIKR